MEARAGPREAHARGAPEDSWIMSGRQVCARVGGGALGCLVQVWATNIFDPVTWRVASLRWDRDHVKRTFKARRRTAGSRGGVEYALVQGPWCVCCQARCGPECTRGLAAGGLSVQIETTTIRSARSMCVRRYLGPVEVPSMRSSRRNGVFRGKQQFRYWWMRGGRTEARLAP